MILCQMNLTDKITWLASDWLSQDKIRSIRCLIALDMQMSPSWSQSRHTCGSLMSCSGKPERGDFNDMLQHEGDSHSLQLICNIWFLAKCISVFILAGKPFGGMPGEGQELLFILRGWVQSHEQSLIHVLIYILVDGVPHAFWAYHFKVGILKAWESLMHLTVC